MIGIYKITNKLTGKSYIGQSIHCGRRLDEHCRGKSQFIDQMIEFDGIDNYTFEIIKTVKKEELNYWEDYYIIKYNTMYPNGYNKKWNTSEDIRKTMKVVPIQNFYQTVNIIEQEEDEQLAEEELQQLDKWKKLRKEWENGNIIFFDYYNDPYIHNNFNPEKTYLHLWDQKDFMHMPRSQHEFKERKREMREKEKKLQRPTLCRINEEEYRLKCMNFSKSKQNKCEDLREALYLYNTLDNIYYLNEYGVIKTEKIGGNFIIDTTYNCLAKFFGDGHENTSRKTWMEIFETDVISKENIKIIDKNNQEMDFKIAKIKYKLISKILFY